MSVCAVVLAKDEVDIIEHTVRHLLANVDEVIVADNLSTDGTRRILAELVREFDGSLLVLNDDEIGYYQAKKTTALAMRALERGHRWVIPCDADEIWLTPDGRPIRDWLDGIGREIQFVKAAIYNHVCTALDPPYPKPEVNPEFLERLGIRGAAGAVEPNPCRRIGWRQRTHLAIQWGKVACRLRPDLEIHQGNHSARTHGVGTTALGLEIRHFPYRGAEHFAKKAINGASAYAATDLDEGTGAHWRIYGKAIQEGGREAGYAWFYDAFFSNDPFSDDSLVYDPAPFAGGKEEPDGRHQEDGPPDVERDVGEAG